MKNEDIITCLSDPVQSKLFLSVIKNQLITSKDLLKDNPSIPQATLYRTLSKLVEKKLLIVAKENKIRGISEKVYSVNPDFQQENLNTLMTEDPQIYFRMFSLFMAELLNIFKEYTDKEAIDIRQDGSAFSTVPFYATYDELEKISEEIGQIMTPYFEQKSPDQQLRTMTLIVSPPQLLKNAEESQRNRDD